mmetsp:Transcript_30365/g.63635  ORF Transcript_30365/g.63635 Transcript_30365/m.63635 type:complete len:278 (+) Transcript_30365:1476-2309(+)
MLLLVVAKELPPTTPASTILSSSVVSPKHPAQVLRMPESRTIPVRSFRNAKSFSASNSVMKVSPSEFFEAFPEAYRRVLMVLVFVEAVAAARFVLDLASFSFPGLRCLVEKDDPDETRCSSSRVSSSLWRIRSSLSLAALRSLATACASRSASAAFSFAIRCSSRSLVRRIVSSAIVGSLSREASRWARRAAASSSLRAILRISSFVWSSESSGLCLRRLLRNRWARRFRAFSASELVLLLPGGDSGRPAMRSLRFLRACSWLRAALASRRAVWRVA